MHTRLVASNSSSSVGCIVYFRGEKLVMLLSLLPGKIYVVRSAQFPIWRELMRETFSYSNAPS